MDTIILVGLGIVMLALFLWVVWSGSNQPAPPLPNEPSLSPVQDSLRCHLCTDYSLSLEEEQQLHRRIEQLHRTHPSRQRGFASLSTTGIARLPRE